MKHVSIIGDPFDGGFYAYGPFDSKEDADNYGQVYDGTDYYWSVPLHQPEEPEPPDPDYDAPSAQERYEQAHKAKRETR